MIVVDASVILDVLLRVPEVEQIEDRLFRRRETLHAPHLLDVEVSQVLRRYTLSRDMTAERGAEALADLLSLRLVRYPHTVLLSRVWELRDNFTAYNAVYVALAEALRVPLVTRDERLAAAPGHGAIVEVV